MLNLHLSNQFYSKLLTFIMLVRQKNDITFWETMIYLSTKWPTK